MRKNNLEYRDLRWEQRATANEKGGFAGHASAFYSCDNYSTIFAPGCFEEGLPEFRERGFVAGLNHQHSNPIGRPSTVKEDDTGLYAECTELVDTAHAQECREWLVKGVVKFMSIGFRPLIRTFLESIDGVEKWWEERSYTPNTDDRENAKYGAIVFEKVKLYEFCPVTIPGQWGAKVLSARSGGGSQPEEVENDLNSVVCELEEAVSELEFVRGQRASKGKDISPMRKIELRRASDLLKRIDSLLAPTPEGGIDLAKAKAAAQMALLSSSKNT